MTRNWEQDIFRCIGMSLNEACENLRCGRSEFYEKVHEMEDRGLIELVDNPKHNQSKIISSPSIEWTEKFDFLDYFSATNTMIEHNFQGLVSEFKDQRIYSDKSNKMLKKYEKPFDLLCYMINKVIDDTSSLTFFSALYNLPINQHEGEKISEITKSNVKVISKVLKKLPLKKNPQLYDDIMKRIPQFEKLLKLKNVDWTNEPVLNNGKLFGNYSTIK